MVPMTTFVLPAAEGQPFTVTVTEYVPASAVVALAMVGFCSAEVQPFTVMVTEYVPASAVMALDIVGFCADELKAFGPVHAYVAPLSGGVESEMVAPWQNGPPLDAAGVDGMALTTTLVVPAAEV